MECVSLCSHAAMNQENRLDCRLMHVQAHKEEEKPQEWEVAEPAQEGADGSDVEWEEA